MNDDTYPRFRWLERGEGEPVVFLHGLMGHMHFWDTTLDILSGGCRALAPTLPVFDEDLPEVSIAELARWVVRFLDALNLGRVVLGGNSLGGHVALATTLVFPTRVAGLVLTGSSGLFERGFTREGSHRPSSEYVRRKMEDVFYDRRLVTPNWVEAVRGTLTNRATALRVLRFARAAKRDNVGHDLGVIDVPTLLVWGAEDRITPPAVAGRFAALIPSSRLVFLRRCGHAPMLEQPEAFGAVVRAWLEDMALIGSGALPDHGLR
ncbi:MAG TPA: alpha/beta fold hydrolase [Methylomirabilota bacterium]